MQITFTPYAGGGFVCVPESGAEFSYLLELVEALPPAFGASTTLPGLPAPRGDCEGLWLPASPYGVNVGQVLFDICCLRPEVAQALTAAWQAALEEAAALAAALEHA